MQTSLNSEDLARYVSALLRNYLPDGFVAPQNLNLMIDHALERLEFCFDKINRNYYRIKLGTRFDHLHSDHMASFLWFLGNTCWKANGDEALPVRLSYLNKIMHGFDCYFHVPLPDIFLLLHPVGTVINGEASFGDYLVLSQNCTIGTQRNNSPRLGRGVILYSNCRVIGNCEVGDEVVFGASTFVLNSVIPKQTVVHGRHPQNLFRANNITALDREFNIGNGARMLGRLAND